MLQAEPLTGNDGKCLSTPHVTLPRATSMMCSDVATYWSAKTRQIGSNLEEYAASEAAVPQTETPSAVSVMLPVAAAFDFPAAATTLLSIAAAVVFHAQQQV